MSEVVVPLVVALPSTKIPASSSPRPSRWSANCRRASQWMPMTTTRCPGGDALLAHPAALHARERRGGVRERPDAGAADDGTTLNRIEGGAELGSRRIWALPNPLVIPRKNAQNSVATFFQPDRENATRVFKHYQAEQRLRITRERCQQSLNAGGHRAGARYRRQSALIRLPSLVRCDEGHR